MKKIIVLIAMILLVGCKDNVAAPENAFVGDVVEVSLPSNNTTNNPVNETVNEPDDSVEAEDDAVTDEPVTIEITELTDKERNIEALTKEDVLWLQESLKIAGYYTGRDGSFGNDTQAKLEAFQTANNLESGLYDEITKEALVTIRIDHEAPNYMTDLVLINKNYFLPSEFVPTNLRAVNVHKNKEIDLPSHVADQVEAMFKAAEEDGLYISLASGYRSYDYQEGIFSRRVANNGFEEAETVVAIPGESEHQTGLAIDVTSEAMGYGLDQSFEQQLEFIWMMENCYKFGFILRYPSDKTEITKYVYEPWHYRYIGDVVMAKDIMDQGMTLEEYFDQ